MKSGQTEILSVVIMAGIVIALVGAAYMWGSPMMEKRSIQTKYASAEKFMSMLNDKITEIATTCATPGGCTYTVDMPQIEAASMTFDNDANTIFFRFPSNQKMLENEKTPINTPYTDDPADYGTAPPGVLMASGVMQDDAYLIQISLKYRELVDMDSKISYLINITGNVKGTQKVIITYLGTRQVQSDIPEANELTMTDILINII
ncbi:MAG: hypothetical protein GXO64_04750 [Candidatus Micrarchaeota archaeon]|nr:hypothetical protein [Candidatus Micrarchaeota archaeon]